MKEGIVISVSWMFLKRAMLATLPILGVEDSRAFYKKARAIYEREMAALPEYGEGDVLKLNLAQAVMLGAIYEACNPKSDIDTLARFYHKFLTHPALLRKLMRGRDMLAPSEVQRQVDIGKKSQRATHPFTWQFSVEVEDADRFTATFTRCGIYDYLKSRGMAHIVPAMCAIDYDMGEISNHLFLRDHTLATGGAVCDCHYVRKSAATDDERKKSQDDRRQEALRGGRTLAQGGAVCDQLIEGDKHAHGKKATTRKDLVRGAYKALGDSATVYDAMMTCGTPLGVAMSWVVWLIGPKENAAYLEAAMAGVPEGFSGSLLEVPVGTGVLTMPLYQTLPDAQVTCLDYSSDMMAAAQARAERDGLSNVSFMQGDVGALPFEDESFDIVLSLNGFHAFPDKEAAYAETFRVLKPGGVFCGCFYVQGEVALTDGWIRRFHEPLGFFTPPYETVASLKERLRSRYVQVHVETHKAMACFTCVK